MSTHRTKAEAMKAAAFWRKRGMRVTVTRKPKLRASSTKTGKVVMRDAWQVDAK